MKNSPLLLLLLMLATQSVTSQQASIQPATIFQLKPLDQWDKKLITYFPEDVDTLFRHIDYMNYRVLLPFKRLFDSSRTDTTLRRKVLERVSSLTSAIPVNIDSIKGAAFFGQREANSKDTADISFLYYNTNKELNDYLQSLQSLKQEAELLFNPHPTLIAFRHDNFLNAYYFMCNTRSLLLAAIDNLLRYYYLGTEAITVRNNTIYIRDTVQQLDTLDKGISRLLRQPFQPSGDLSIHRRPAHEDQKDLINSSANAILTDQRKNWWWRGLLAGIAGGLLAGILLHNTR